MGSPGCDANRSNSVRRAKFPTKILVLLEPGQGNLGRWIPAAPRVSTCPCPPSGNEGAQFKSPVFRARNNHSCLPHPRTRRGDADYKAQQAYEMTVITHMATHGRRHRSVSGQDPFGPLEVRRVPQVYFLPLLYGELNGAAPTMQCPLGGFSDQPPSLACGRLHSFFSPLVSISIPRRKAERPQQYEGSPSRACV